MQHPENKLWKLLALKLSGEITPGELSELNEYLKTSPDEKEIVNLIETYWDQKDDIININDEMEEERFHLILHSENQEELEIESGRVIPKINSTGFYKHKWFYAAASVIIILLWTGFFIKRHSNIDAVADAKGNTRHVTVKPGSKSQVILPDGTVVRLNGSSKLSYNNDFNKKVREVELEGEAFFDVTKDANHPFIVHTSNIDIKVLGTLFNVKSYEQDQSIETTLLRGSVEVYEKNDPSAPKVILKPNEKLVFRKEPGKTLPLQNKPDVNPLNKMVPDENISVSTLSATKPDSLREETSWLYNKLVIDGDDFNKMAGKMERWYGVKIEILSPGLGQYHFKGVFENETIEQALAALQLTVKFQYKIDNDIVKIME